MCHRILATLVVSREEKKNDTDGITWPNLVAVMHNIQMMGEARAIPSNC